MTKKQIYGLFIGIFIIFQVLKNIIKTSEGAGGIIAACLAGFLFLIVLSTWLVKPLSNMLLRFSRYGSFLLTKEEKRSSNFVAGSLCVFIASCLLYFYNAKFATVAIFAFAMMFPFSVIFTPSKYRYLLRIYACVLAALGIYSIVYFFFTGVPIAMLVFFIFFIVFLFLVNYLRIKESNR